MKGNVAFISLGCDKNTVDSEVMVGLMKEGGYNIVSEEKNADVIVINTCCFIKDALEESIEAVIEAAKYKEEGICKGIIMAGCLAQRYEKDIFIELPEVDAIVGTAGFEDIVKAADSVLGGDKFKNLPSIDTSLADENGLKRVVSTAGSSAYLKISEGCNNFCTYCIIPKVRGKHRSRGMDSLIKEAENLASQGIKELIIVGQDTAIYGEDIYGESRLYELLNKLSLVEGIEWIRLLYCYPEHLTDETIKVMAENDKICKYIDMPIQHANDNVLKRMGRRSNQKELLEVIEKLRKYMPEIAIRTTLITGFPGESEDEFKDMLNFINKVKFDRLGVFTYSQEEGTPAAKMDGQIDEDIKEERKDIIMETQKFISAQKSEEMIGKQIKVIVEGKLPEDDVYCTRSYKDSPDIDGLVFVTSEEELISGDLVDIKITAASDYDLYGEVF